jgi:hypothetical protein
MPKPHPHAEATYRVLLQTDKTYAVEVTIPETLPTTIKSFATEADAEAWIANHKRQVVENAPRRWRGKRA